MIKILEEKKQITVNDDNITVTVKLNLDDITNIIPGLRSCFCIMSDDMEFIGVAHLHEGDECNVLEATRIAEAKMERKFYRFVKRTLKELTECFSKSLESIEKDSKKTDNTLKQIDLHIKEICNRL